MDNLTYYDNLKRRSEARKAADKRYREKHKEKVRKKTILNNWKKRGVINDNFDELYNYYINCFKCESCDCDIVPGNCKNGRYLDHDHETGLFRNIVCPKCNVIRRYQDAGTIPLTRKEIYFKSKLKNFILS